MIIDRVVHPGFMVNSWLVAGREEARGLLIDTGADPREILAMVRRHNVNVVAIVCTHRHRDHVSGNDYLSRNLDAPIFAHPVEKRFVPGATEEAPEGHTWTFSEWTAKVIHIPGHTAGQIGVVVPGVGVWTADTLFRCSVGGTVGTGHSTFDDLKSSILDKVLSLPAETKIYPGHGDESSVGHELERNPFVRVWRGLDQPSSRPARVDGKRATVEIWAKDYDSGHKAQVRFNDGRTDVVPGSRVQKVTL